jgi:hypothetical protein
MRNARVKFTWTEVPSAAAITQAEQATFEAALIEEVQAAGEGVPEARAVLDRLCASVDREALLAALLKRELDRLPKGESLRPVHIKEAQGTPDRFPVDGPRRSHDDFARDSVVFRINLGAQSKAEPGWLLPLICRRGGVTRRDVGAIRVGQRYSEFEIAGNAAQDFALSASLMDPRAPHVRIERVSSEARHMARREPEPAPPIREQHRPRAAREPAGEVRPTKVHRMPGREHRPSRPVHPAAPSTHKPTHQPRPAKIPHQKVQSHVGPGFKNPRPHTGNTGGLHPYRGRAQAHPGKKR